MRDAKQATELI